MIKIPVAFNSDDKGYLDRECPNEYCLFSFKIYMDDWTNKVSDEEVYCPMCGHVASSDKWWTQKQLSDMQEMASSWAKSYIQDELNKRLKNLERSTRGNEFVKITYKPDRKITFINNPLGQSDEWEQDIQCPKCLTRYSVIGSAYFCPCCGHNVIENIFDESLDNIKKMISSLDEMKSLFTDLYGQDKANSMCRAMLESSLGDVISAFQKFAEVRFAALSAKKVRANDFQMLDKGSELFEKFIGNGYSEWLNQSELNELKLAFQKRHVFEHNAGMVDKSYLEKTGDQSYEIGQRIVLHRHEVLRIVDLIKKLSLGIRGLVVTL